MQYKELTFGDEAIRILQTALGQPIAAHLFRNECERLGFDLDSLDVYEYMILVERVGGLLCDIVGACQASHVVVELCQIGLNAADTDTVEERSPHDLSETLVEDRDYAFTFNHL